MQTQLEISVLNQYSNYSERRLEKEELLRHLQQEESQALVNDNYDLAEEVNVKIDQVKTELEDMRTLLPGEDREVYGSYSTGVIVQMTSFGSSEYLSRH